MILWLDSHLSPAIARWISTHFAVQAVHVSALGLRQAKDLQIFLAARQANAVVMTKDSDFAHLVESYGPLPQVILLTCGNTSNMRLQEILTEQLQMALERLQAGHPLVEIDNLPPAPASPTTGPPPL